MSLPANSVFPGGYPEGGLSLALARRQPFTPQPPILPYYVDYANGSRSGDGLSPITAVNSAATLRSRWGTDLRPQIAPGTIVVNALSSAPDTSDPWSVLVDADFAQGSKIIFQGAARSALRSGTIATISAFARTSANGQVLVTDAGVADFSPYVTNLVVDTSRPLVGWLYEPTNGSSATGILSPTRAPQVAGSLSFPATSLPLAGDTYSVVPLTSIYFGSGSHSKAYPQGAFSGSGAGTATVYFNRLHLTTNGPTEMLSFLSDSQMGFVLQECMIDQNLTITSQVILMNCWQTNKNRAIVTNYNFGSIWHGGGSYGNAFAFGAALNIDGDFVFDVGCAGGGNGSIRTRNGQDEMAGMGVFILGNVSYWRSGGAQPALDLAPLTAMRVIADFDSPGTLYGTVGSGNDVAHVSSMGLLEYASTATAAFAMDQTTFKLGGQSNGWGFNPATGRFCGTADGSPAAITVAAIDAALNGPGFGGFVQDPTSGARIGKYVA